MKPFSEGEPGSLRIWPDKWNAWNQHLATKDDWVGRPRLFRKRCEEEIQQAKPGFPLSGKTCEDVKNKPGKTGKNDGHWWKLMMTIDMIWDQPLSYQNFPLSIVLN